MTTTSSQRLSRMLALVPWLQARPGITLAECADHFKVTVDELEADLWTIVMCGVPGYGPDQLVDIQFWDDGRVIVIDALTLDQPLRLTPDESLAVLLGLRLLAQVPGITERDAIVTAAAKLEALGSSLPEAITVVVPVNEAIRTALDEALTTGQGLEIEYAAATGDAVTRRVIHPSRVHTADSVGYLDAWCTLAGAQRTFRIDRILHADIIPAPSYDTLSSPSMPHEGQATATRTTWRLEPSARWITDVISGVEVESRLEDGSLVVAVPVRDLRWAASFVLSQGGKVTVLSPEDLVEMVSDAASAALGSYS